MIVDTGTPANRKQWVEDVFAMVKPKDVRWVFLSHDDVDHSGNLDEVMTACPNARLVVNWAMVESHTNCFNFPNDRATVRSLPSVEPPPLPDQSVLEQIIAATSQPPA